MSGVVILLEADVVRPILAKRFRGIIYSVGKLHQGSDFVGFDTPQSTDHDWGPGKIDLLLHEEECDRFGEDITGILADEFPPTFRELPTGFVTPETDGGSIWFGIGSFAIIVAPIFHSVLNSWSRKDREAPLASAYLHIAGMLNKLNVTEHIEATKGQFLGRLYQVLQSERPVEALYSSISSDALLNLPRYLAGLHNTLIPQIYWIE